MSNNPYLSKSTFIRGLQCEKSLYLHKMHPELRGEIDQNQEAIFAQGTTVGELAQQLFPGGKDCSFSDFGEINDSIKRTKNYMERGEPIIYEAAFRYENILVFADILVQDEEGWKLYEVKSSTGVKEVYEKDAALQTYVLNNCGIELADIFIVHINNQYTRRGALEIDKLFSIASVKERALELLEETPNQIARLRDVLSQGEIPNVNIGPHCGDPYPCDFRGHCWKNMPEQSVFNIANLRSKKKWELYDRDVLSMLDIPDDYHLGSRQRRQIDGVRNGTSFIDEAQINGFLQSLNYPLYFLDFETINPAVPLYDESRPYQQITFQYSLHIQMEPGGVCEHREYLGETDGTDPRIAFGRQLLVDCGEAGDVIVYNKGFENGKIEDLKALFPEVTASLQTIQSRIVDLMVPFQKGWYYTPEMQGSYSIKYVLPALVPDESYQGMAIADGGTASLYYKAMAEGNFQGDIEKTRQDLLAYCKLDTWAMVRILEKLNEVLITLNITK
ncbi:MAG: DUF2779 domain-containing protein [Cyclobacteriaceae bacterium]